MAVVALAIYAFSLLTTFVLRILLQYRRTGSTGFHGLGGRPGSADWWGGVLFVLALTLCLAGPVLQLTGLVPAVAVLDTTALHVGGLLLAAAGTIGTVTAQHTMGTSWRLGVDQQDTTRLVTAGVFATVRNPIFTTMITAVVGLTLLNPNPIALLGLAALVTAIEIQVRAVEEPYLLRTHGQSYRDYASRVGRFLPRAGRLTTAAGGGRSTR